MNNQIPPIMNQPTISDNINQLPIPVVSAIHQNQPNNDTNSVIPSSPSEKTIAHIDFIVGRGRNKPDGHINFPLNMVFKNRNVVYIDPDETTGSDIRQCIQDVDFSQFNISKNDDTNEKIQIRFLFDWSSFYCSAMVHLPDIAKKLKRRFKVLVPLNNDETHVPSEVKQYLHDSIFTLATVDGQYPLFDWNNNTDNFNLINKKRYMMIYVYD